MNINISLYAKKKKKTYPLPIFCSISKSPFGSSGLTKLYKSSIVDSTSTTGGSTGALGDSGAGRVGITGEGAGDRTDGRKGAGEGAGPKGNFGTEVLGGKGAGAWPEEVECGPPGVGAGPKGVLIGGEGATKWMEVGGEGA